MKLNKRTKRVFLEHKASYIGMVILIILSTSCYIGFKSSTTSMHDNVIKNRIEQRLEDANFELAKPITQEEIKSYETKFDLTLQENKYINWEYKGAKLKIIPEANKINLPLLSKGKYLSLDTDIMVDNYFFSAQKLSFGDKLKVKDKEFTICGTFTTPDTLSLLKSDTDFMADGKKYGYCMISKKAFNIFDKTDVNANYSTIFKKDNADDFRREISNSNYVLEWVSKDSNKRITTFDSESSAIVAMSKIAPLFVLVIATLIMTVVLSRMLKKEYTYIGTLTALGYRKREIAAHYLCLPVLISLAGSIVGAGIGFLLVEPFALITSVEYNVPKLPITVNWYDIAMVVLLPVFLNTLSALISVLKALKINIVSLLKANGSKEKRSLLLKAIPHKKGPFKLRFKLKEIFSNIPRSFLMLVGVTAASMFMMTGFLFYGCIDFLFENNFNAVFGYDYQYVFNKLQTEDLKDGEPFMIAGFEFVQDGKTIGLDINGVPNNPKYIRLKNKDGALISTDRTVITSSVAKRLKLKKGDTITVKNVSSMKSYDITIDEVCNIKFSEYIYMPMAKLNKMLGLPENAYIGAYSDKLLDIDDSIVEKILTLEDSKSGLDASINAFRSFLYILAAFAAVIGVIVVYIVTIMLVEENRKNISMLKVMGYRNEEISRLLINSTSVLVWIGFFLAVPVTIRLIQVFLDILTKTMFFDFTTSLSWWQAVISFAFIMAVYYVTLFFTRNKVLNINMAESLKARE